MGVTAGVGVALEAGWPVFGLSGALVSQALVGIVLWKVLAVGVGRLRASMTDEVTAAAMRPAEAFRLRPRPA